MENKNYENQMDDKEWKKSMVKEVDEGEPELQ